jgi:hypothetical protein
VLANPCAHLRLCAAADQPHGALPGLRTSGRFGTRLTAAFPQVAADWGYATDFEMKLGRRWRAGGARRSYLSAGCPAPRGFNRALFTLARWTYTFDDGRLLESSLVRECRVRG